MIALGQVARHRFPRGRGDEPLHLHVRTPVYCSFPHGCGDATGFAIESATAVIDYRRNRR